MTLVEQAKSVTSTRLPTIKYQNRVYTPNDLPKPGAFNRWVPSRTELFFRAVDGGLLSAEIFCQNYDVSQAEFDVWKLRYAAHGRPGLTLRMRPTIRAEVNDATADDTPPLQDEVKMEVVSIGDFKIDPEQLIVAYKENELKLEPREWEVLLLLLRHRGKVVTRDMFLDDIYDGEAEPDIKTIDVFTCKMRRRLFRETGAENFIESVWGRGYRIP